MKRPDLKFWRKKKRPDDGVEEIQFRPESNFYYAGVSSRFSFTAIILITALVLFTAGSLIFGAGLFTYENLFYLVKDIDAAGDSGAAVEMISYSSSDTQSYAAYKKGVAVLGGSQLSVYSASGKKTLETAVNYSDPVLLSSDKYLLAYDVGGRRLSLFNSFANIYSAEYENPVYDAAIADNGYFAVVTSTEEYNSLIEIYDSDFRLVNQIGRKGFVTDVAFSKSADNCCFISLDASGGEYAAEFSVFRVGTEKISDPMRFNGVTPYACEFLSSDRIALICDGLTYILDNSGNVINRYFYSGEKLTSYACGGGHAALIFERDPVNNIYGITVLDGNGKTVGSREVTEEIIGAAISGGKLFTFGPENVTRYALSGGKGQTVGTGLRARAVIPIDGSKVLVCSQVGAKYITIN